MTHNLDIIHATEEIITYVQEEMDTWLADNDLTLEFDTTHLEGLIEETLIGLMEE